MKMNDFGFMLGELCKDREKIFIFRDIEDKTIVEIRVVFFHYFLNVLVDIDIFIF